MGNSPVVVCSGFIESDYPGANLQSENSRFLSPLSYYKLTVPVYAMPYDLNSEAMKDGNEFLAQVEPKHQRFLALQNHPPYELLNWLARTASGSYTVRKLGVFEGVEVLEFRPRTPADLPGAAGKKFANQ